jgi:hypothetical protein
MSAPKKKGKHFSTVDIALLGVFCALWTTLNLTLARLGFAWFGLPIFCDFAAFFTLLLGTWAIGKFGAATLIGVIGSIVTVLFGGSTTTFGFALSAVFFDILTLANHHKFLLKPYNVIVAVLATVTSAYIAGVIIGVFFMYRPLDWALTFWGGWHLFGGVISILGALPVIGILEKTNVRKIKSA